MTYKRKIQLSTPIDSQKYDPFKRYYVAAGFVKPVREDSSLHAVKTEAGSKVSWSLGGYQQDNQDAAKIPTQKQMDDWVLAHKSDLQDEAEALDNEYLAIAPDGESIISLPKVLQQLRINTVDKVMRTQADAVKTFLTPVRLYNEDGNISEDARPFLETIARLSDTQGPLYERVTAILNREPIPGLEDDLGDIFDFSTLYLYAGVGTEAVQDKLAVFEAVRQQLGMERIKRILSFVPQEQRTTYELLQVLEDTPYVSRSDIYPFLEQNAGLANDEGVSEVDPEYNSFNDKYEQAISASSVIETTQPNIYLYDLYTSADIDDEGRRVAGSWQGDPSLSNVVQLKYGTSVTLDGNIEQGQGVLNDRSLSDYLDVFSKELECNLTDDQKIKIDNLLKKVIIPSTDSQMLGKINDKKRSFPMYIGISFSSDDIGSIGQIIQNNNTSTTVLDYLTQENGQTKQYNVKSDLFIGNEYSDRSNENEYIASLYNLGDKSLKISDIGLALEYGTNGEVVQGLTITESGLEPLTGVGLSDQQKTNLDRASVNISSIIQEKAKSYADYLSDLRTQSYSEVLGYKISKFDSDDRKMQEIIFGNSLETKETTFVDTQVKYNTNYRYELSEFRVVVGTQYDMLVFGQEPSELNTLIDQEKPETLVPSLVSYEIETLETPMVEIVEVPIYGSFYKIDAFPELTFGITYPPVKIMDYPPAAPDLQILPLLDNYRQIKINVQLNTGDYTGDFALPLINMPGNQEIIQSLFEYQKQFENFGLKTGHLEYKNEGLDEIQKVHLLRSRDLDLSVAEYNDLYASFFTGETGEIRTLSTDPDSGEEVVVSYDILDDLQPNIYYYYSCYVEDIHGNPSLPTPIYRVRLVYEKGLYIPEIELFNFKPTSNKVSTKKFARFIQIAASEIQTFPFTERDENDVLKGIKNLASEQGKTVSDHSFIFRFTSRDTGRKFDLKINVNEKTLSAEDENILDCE
tara:strand:+ start:2463 stop:5378 length:2916 start_codon:yes stop_codon:yes gene_type:complete